MTQTASPIRIGKCVVCKRTYRAAGNETVWCDCRKGIVCDDRTHTFHDEPGGTPDHPVTGIRWQTVKVTVTEHDCDSRCQHARSGKCACSCGGRNHGIAFAIAAAHNAARRQQTAPADTDLTLF